MSRLSWNVPILVLATLAAFVPFLGKAFHIDDPLFIWCARQIVAHPLDPYGFSANWYGTPAPMAEIMRNPPLASYYLAAAGALVGWSESALHGAFLLVTLACVLGIHALARLLCGRPLLAALLALVCPTFLLSGTTVMCDMLMLAFWVWAVFVWVRGIESGRHGQLALAALLVTAAVMTKFNGLILVPLLFLHAAVRKRGLGLWVLHLAVPIAGLALYLAWAASRYGGSLWGGVGFAMRGVGGPSLAPRTVTLLAFAGGCCVPIVFASVSVWTRRAALRWLLGLLLLVGVLLLSGLVGRADVGALARPGATFLAQMAVLVIGGVTLVRMLWVESRKRLSAEAALLVGWVAATLAFAFVAWSVSGRYLLPMVPAVAILIVRSLEENRLSPTWSARLPLLVLVPSAALTVGAGIADATLAHSAREAARLLCGRSRGAGERLVYQGHWGFQYYMDLCGAEALSGSGTSVSAGDSIVVPENNTNLFRIDPRMARPVEQYEVPLRTPVATMSRPLGAGFHAAVWGPMPFVVGSPPPERYQVLRVTASGIFIRPAAAGVQRAVPPEP